MPEPESNPAERITLGEFLDKANDLPGIDPEHAALTEALNECYDRLDDGARDEVQKLFPTILETSAKVRY